MNNIFGNYHPVVNITYFAGVILFSMFVMHPFFIVVSLVVASVYAVMVKGSSAVKPLAVFITLFTVLAFLNPLFNKHGTTVLFTFANGNNYTLEALCYGLASSGMLLTVCIWFISYSKVMTSDKFIYLFGNILPTISLTLSMIMRLIPTYTNKFYSFINARKCIGKYTSYKGRTKQMKNFSAILSILTSWALESAIITADSMKSRGYTLSPRTSFSLYKFSRKDKNLLIYMVGLICVIIFGATNKTMSVTFIPEIVINDFNTVSFITAIAYFLFLSTPILLNLKEEITWRYLKSKI